MNTTATMLRLETNLLKLSYQKKCSFLISQSQRRPWPQWEFKKLFSVILAQKDSETLKFLPHEIERLHILSLLGFDNQILSELQEQTCLPLGEMIPGFHFPMLQILWCVRNLYQNDKRWALEKQALWTGPWDANCIILMPLRLFCLWGHFCC